MVSIQFDVKATNFATGGPSMAAAAIKADETKTNS